MSFNDLASVNAFLNILSILFLLMGFKEIRNAKRKQHQKWMLAALGSSFLFLISYSIYHAKVGSVPYPHYDWTRPIYFLLLIPHIILAGLIAPFIVYMVYQAWQGKFERHKRIAKVVFPVWLFVSVSGVLVFALLYLR